jgi:hypothetical protein
MGARRAAPQPLAKQQQTRREAGAAAAQRPRSRFGLSEGRIEIKNEAEQSGAEGNERDNLFA